MKLLFTLLFLLPATCCVAQETEQIVVSGRRNAPEQMKKPYVVLISADGFRHDFAVKYHAERLLRLADGGVKAAYMQAAYPTLTFPNHYTLVTGMYPAHHGLVNNSIFDPQTQKSYSIGNRNAVRDSSWYGGVPLWVLAEQNKMLTACFYWVGSEAAILGIRPTYYYNYSEKIKADDRISIVKKWLQLPEDIRPHFITFYLPEVDHAAHHSGPDSKETGDAVAFIDETIKKMTDTLATLGLPINYIFVSDHGMTAVDTAHTLQLPKGVDTAKFRIVPNSALLTLHAKDKAAITPTYQTLKADARDYDVYLAADMPRKWHFSKADDRFNRIGDIILVPHFPMVFHYGKYPPQPGQHGFNPLEPDMSATFYAWGPAFRRKDIKGFENVHVFPLVARLLGLQYYHEIDGEGKKLLKTLKSRL